MFKKFDLKRFISDSFSWESILKVLLWAIAEVLDQLVDGSKLSTKEKKSVQLTYTFAATLGKEWAEDTKDTEIDDEFIEQLMKKCEDTGQEGGFEMPTIPEVL